MKKVILVLSVLFSSCNSKTRIDFEEKINPIKLKDGEYYSNMNSQNGISIRGNKIAFFEKMKFESNDIYAFV